MGGRYTFFMIIPPNLMPLIRAHSRFHAPTIRRLPRSLHLGRRSPSRSRHTRKSPQIVRRALGPVDILAIVRSAQIERAVGLAIEICAAACADERKIRIVGRDAELGGEGGGGGGGVVVRVAGLGLKVG